MKLTAPKGFTLLELTVALGIIAIISTIGLTLYRSTLTKGRDAKRVADMQEVQKALEQYYIINNSTYPTFPGPMNLTFVGPAGPIGNTLNTYFQTGSVPQDPINPTYFYRYSSNNAGNTCANNKYIICAQLENPTGIANRSVLPADACATVTDSGAVFYCLGSLSN